MLKNLAYKSFFLVFFILLSSGCSAPVYHYQDAMSVNMLQPGKKQSIRVLARVEEWRNSGIQIRKGSLYTIKANGKWRTFGTCNFTGPDGIGLYKAWCDNTPLFPALLNGYSHSTLIGRIGEVGEMFAIGSDFEFEAKADGTLYLRINDAINTNHDNEGYVDVDVVAMGQEHQSSASQLAESADFSGFNQSNQIDPKTLGSVNKSRVALIIGNSSYQSSPLKNPVNDASSMASALRKLGFDVLLKLDANQEQMETAIDSFGRQIASGNQVALFYYAGHGVQVDGANYLIPIGTTINRQSDVRYKAINVGQVLGAMGEAQDNLNIVILDACRDNPLPRSFRSGARGLARLEGPKGTIIGFATSPGSVASDGDGDNGVYTKHLLQNMQVSGISIEQVFKKVLQGVNEETNGQQIPWTESSFTGDFSFSPQ
jgi:caspase domain-containing protein